MSAGTEHATRVQGLFGRIAGVYDLLNRCLSLGFDTLWRKRLAESVAPFPRQGTGRILDLAAGTLEVTMNLARRYPARAVLAADFCRPMLVRGLPKLQRLPKNRVLPIAGDARCLPLPGNSVDAVTMAFGLRNVTPRQDVYREVLRVLTPGGKFCVLEFGSTKNRIMGGLYNAYLGWFLPLIGRLVSKDQSAYQYLADTVAAYPEARVLAGEMENAGFERVTYRTYTAGIVCLHVGQKPATPGAPPLPLSCTSERR